MLQRYLHWFPICGGPAFVLRTCPMCTARYNTPNKQGRRKVDAKPNTAQHAMYIHA